jgi:hypothetical protein
VHGFTVRLAGERLVVVEMPDCWAVMNRYDAFPRALGRFPKDEAGWTAAVAELRRSETAAAPLARGRRPARTRYRPDARKQLSLPRIGVLVVAALLGGSTLLPWATTASHAHLTLFGVLDSGPRRSLAWLLVAVAGLAAIESQLARFERVRVFAFLLGVVAAVPVAAAYQQENHLSRFAFFSSGAGRGLHPAPGTYVGAAACVLLLLAWAIFPAPKRAGRVEPVDLPAGEQGPDAFVAAPLLSPAAPNAGLTAHARATAEPVGATPVGAAPAAHGIPEPPALLAPDHHQPGPVRLSGLPPLGEALAQLARTEQPHGGLGTTSTPTTPATAGLGAGNGTGDGSAPPAPSFPAGWYADYAVPGQLRYYDGTAWTAHTHPGTPPS